MSKADELLAEIDAAVERLNKAQARRAALEHPSVCRPLAVMDQIRLVCMLENLVDDEARTVRELLKYALENHT